MTNGGIECRISSQCVSHNKIPRTVHWFIWYAQFFIGTSACRSLDKIEQYLMSEGRAMAEDEK